MHAPPPADAAGQIAWRAPTDYFIRTQRLLNALVTSI
jgi:hypothetical protein